MLDDKLTSIKGVGAELEQKFHILGINTISDLVYNYPRRYEDYSNVQSINEISPGPVTIKGEIKQATGRYVRRG